MTTKRLIACPTAYNIYRVTDEVVQMHKVEMMTLPSAVVMEMLVMKGLAKLVARIKPFDMEDVEDDNEEIEVPDAYVMGDTDEPPVPDNPGEEELPGPWYPKKGEDEE